MKWSEGSGEEVEEEGAEERKRRRRKERDSDVKWRRNGGRGVEWWREWRSREEAVEEESGVT